MEKNEPSKFQRAYGLEVNALNSMFNKAPPKEKKDEDTFDIPEPSAIKEYLDRFVVGQEEAKKAVSTLMVNHLVRFRYNKDIEKDTQKLAKSNVLFVGDSGVGKTYVVKVASEFVDVPLIIEDSTKLTQEGYVGDSVDTILTRLIEAAEGNVEKAERGIIFLDEFDKLGGESDSKDGVSTVGVQQSLLRMVEGAKFNVSDRVGDSRSAKKVEIDTSGITFIFAGAFGGLAKKVKGELKMSVKGGSVETCRKITEHDIIKYGILPEILGRIGRYVVLHELTEEQMLHILTTTENCLVDQYKKLFELRGITWRMTEDNYKEIIESVKKSRLGARGLRHQIEIAVGEDMFNG